MGAAVNGAPGITQCRCRWQVKALRDYCSGRRIGGTVLARTILRAPQGGEAPEPRPGPPAGGRNFLTLPKPLILEYSDSFMSEAISGSCSNGKRIRTQKNPGLRSGAFHLPVFRGFVSDKCRRYRYNDKGLLNAFIREQGISS